MLVSLPPRCPRHGELTSGQRSRPSLEFFLLSRLLLSLNSTDSCPCPDKGRVSACLAEEAGGRQAGLGHVSAPIRSVGGGSGAGTPRRTQRPGRAGHPQPSRSLSSTPSPRGVTRLERQGRVQDGHCLRASDQGVHPLLRGNKNSLSLLIKTRILCRLHNGRLLIKLMTASMSPVRVVYNFHTSLHLTDCIIFITMTMQEKGQCCFSST